MVSTSLEEAARHWGYPAIVLNLHFIPQSILREVLQHPRFKAVLKQYGIDNTWRDELMAMVNDLTDITGIHVQLDEEY